MSSASIVSAGSPVAPTRGHAAPRWSAGKLGLLALFLLAAQCGPPESVHPLSDPSQAKPDLRLVGKWVGVEQGAESRENLIFESVDEHWMRVRILDEGEREKPIPTFVTELDGKTYLNLEDDSDDPNSPGKGYLIVHYELAADGTMRVGLMDEKFIGRCITEGRLQGTIRGEGDSRSVRITESTERLVEFVRNTPAEELFSYSERWRKVEDAEKAPPQPERQPG